MSRSRKARAAIRTAAAIGVIFGITQVPAAVAESKTPPDCVTKQFREDAYITHRTDRNIPGSSTGDVAIAEDRLFDQKGRRIGTTDSRGVMVLVGDPSSNPAGLDMQMMFEAYDRFNDGTVFVAGIASIAGVTEHGQTATLAASGVSGVYKGKIGVRTFKLAQVLPDHIVYQSDLKVCTPPPFPAAGQGH